MHGDIQVKSTRDIGSVFTFTIRVKNGASVAEPNANDPRASSMNMLITQLGQPRILMVCLDRVKLMIESFIPWIERLENRSNMDDAISLALGSAAEGLPYDCIIIDSPLTETMVKLVTAIEKNPQLQNMRVLLLIAPTVENIRRHFANSGITNSDESPRPHQIFHPLVTQLSKPVRRAKLLNVLVKLLSNPAVTMVSPSESSDHKYSGSITPVSATTAKRLNVGLRVELSSYSTQGNQAFLPEELAVFKGQRILVAEDNFIAQRLIVKQLAKLGFVVDKCNNGFECFDTWKSNKPGHYILAWIDHHMPGCDGLEATRMIRRYEKEMNCIPALPIIALTGNENMKRYNSL